MYDRIIDCEYHVVKKQKEPIYIIMNSLDESLAYVYRIIYINETNTNSYDIRISYELNYNKYKKLNSNEITMVRIMFDNLVGMLNYDLKTLFTEDLNDRMNLPFYENILKVKVYKG